MRCTNFQILLLCFITIVNPAVGGMASGASPDEPVLAVPVVGKQFRARLIKIDSNWRMTLNDGERERIVSTGDLVRWGTFHENSSASRLVLRDGSILVADVMDIDDTSVTV